MQVRKLFAWKNIYLIGNDGHTMNRGFTLIEMIIALGIFTAIILLSIATILSLNTAQKKAINLQNVHDNIRFALETMAKEIRRGNNFSRPCEWPSGCSELSFRQSLTEQPIVYRLQNGVIEQSFDGGPFLPLTDPQRAITKLVFLVHGVVGLEQARITILMEMESGLVSKDRERATLRMQTTIAKQEL